MATTVKSHSRSVKGKGNTSVKRHSRKAGKQTLGHKVKTSLAYKGVKNPIRSDMESTREQLKDGGFKTSLSAMKKGGIAEKRAYIMAHKLDDFTGSHKVDGTKKSRKSSKLHKPMVKKKVAANSVEAYKRFTTKKRR
jgi:hypothetical protein